MTEATRGEQMAKRWQPPPLSDATEGDAVTLDEKVVRKMLQVNPAMRGGRTTYQVKRDMEQGAAPAAPNAAPTAAPATPTRSKSDLDDTVGFFVDGKGRELETKLRDLAARRAALAEEERALREQFTADAAKFLAMLDPQVVALHGVTALSKHKDLLAAVGTTPKELLAAARKARG